MTSFDEQICKRQLRYIDVEHFDKKWKLARMGVGLCTTLSTHHK